MLNSHSATPLYKQLIGALASKIEAGVYRDGDKLPTESELVEEYGVSRITVRAAIKEMEDEGLVVRARGKGTFVTTSKELYSANDEESFSRSCRLAGKHASTKVLDFGLAVPSPNDARFLGLSEDCPVLRSRRLRFVDGVPTMVETNCYAHALDFIKNEDLNGSLLDIMCTHGVRLGKSARTLEVCYANAFESEYLGVQPGAALLLFVDKWFDQDSVPLFISRQAYCTKHLKFYL